MKQWDKCSVQGPLDSDDVSIAVTLLQISVSVRCREKGYRYKISLQIIDTRYWYKVWLKDISTRYRYKLLLSV